MTKKEWLTCNDSQQMLRLLQEKGMLSEREARLSKRKVQLFAAACCRRIWHFLTDARSRIAVEIAEQYADGLQSEQDLTTVERPALQAGSEAFDDVIRGQAGTYYHAAMAAWLTVNSPTSSSVEVVVRRAIWVTVCDHDTRDEENAAQAILLRDIIFDPVSTLPVIAPSVKVWSDATIPRLAQAAYEHRTLPDGHLDTSRLAVLADALEDAGCMTTPLMEHLRGPGPHVRGCWAIDLLLGKS
jgi:hypothetical protein